MRQRNYFVYILTNTAHTVLYTGVTADLTRRMYEHRNGVADGFTKRYHVHQLIYFEQTDDVYAAISREKEIKGWRREKKIALISRMNPKWIDLAQDWFA